MVVVVVAVVTLDWTPKNVWKAVDIVLKNVDIVAAIGYVMKD